MTTGTLRVGMVGYAFMGKAHSQAWRTVNRVFDLPLRVEMVSVAGRDGTAAAVGPLRVAGLGGTFAPTWFDTPAANLPHTPRDDKRRHFVREETEACKRLSQIDILMTHEAARPFILVDEGTAGARPRRPQANCPRLGSLSALTPQP